MDSIVYIEFTTTAKKQWYSRFFSWCIRTFQKTPYSHVRLRWFSKSGIELIYEAGGTTVRVIGGKAQPDNPVTLIKSYEVTVTPEEYRKLIRLFDYSSVNYGFKQVIGIWLAKIFNLSKNPFANGRNSQVCSELVGLFLKEVKGWEIDMNLDLAGPKEIDEFLQKKLNMGSKS